MISNTGSLLDIFTERPYRYRLLNKGLKFICSDNNRNHATNILEIGCAYGDGAAYIAKAYNCCVTGVDISSYLIADASVRHKDLISDGILNFNIENAESLSFEDESFEVLVSEAAFSPIINKEAAISEYYRVLKKGGFIVINDFSIKASLSGDKRLDVSYIPCFSGVETMEKYKKLFERSGFNAILIKEEYGELISLSMWLSKVFGISITEIGSYLSKYYNYNRTDQIYKGKSDFFNKAKFTYCQMIFKK